MDYNQNGYGLQADYLPDLMNGMKDKVLVEFHFFLPGKKNYFQKRWFFFFFWMSTANIKFHASLRPQGPKQPPNIITDTSEIAHMCHIPYFIPTKIKLWSSILNAHFQLMEIGILSQVCVFVGVCVPSWHFADTDQYWQTSSSILEDGQSQGGKWERE